jgi:hypothetical protein
VKFEIEASGSGDYGDFAAVRVYFDEESWVEIDAADAHGHLRSDVQYTEGAKITVHHADGTEEEVWDDVVMPGWFAKRLRETAHATPHADR